MALVASKITRVTLAADRTISDGTIRVHNILVSNPTKATLEVVFTDREGTPNLNITAPWFGSHTFKHCWVADKGLSVLGVGGDGADVVVTVIHSQDGA